MYLTQNICQNYLSWEDFIPIIINHYMYGIILKVGKKILRSQFRIFRPYFRHQVSQIQNFANLLPASQEKFLLLKLNEKSPTPLAETGEAESHIHWAASIKKCFKPCLYNRSQLPQKKKQEISRSCIISRSHVISRSCAISHLK